MRRAVKAFNTICSCSFTLCVIMSLVVAFSCFLFSRLGAADRHAGQGGGGDPPSLGR
jgi:hypothetical protein